MVDSKIAGSEMDSVEVKNMVGCKLSLMGSGVVGAVGSGVVGIVGSGVVGDVGSGVVSLSMQDGLPGNYLQELVSPGRGQSFQGQRGSRRQNVAYRK